MDFFVWGIFRLFDTGLLKWITGHYGITPDRPQAAWLIGGGILLCVVISYLLGSINFALVVSKLFFHDDVRKHGSGNAGATNITRTYGKKAGILTFLGDGLKGVVSILIGCFVFGGILPDLITVAYLSAFMCIVGHVFPIFAHFQGGKGFATTVMCILVLNPVISVILLAVFLIIALGTKYISLGSVVTALCYPVFLSMFDPLAPYPYGSYGVNVIFAFLIAVLVTWAHRANLKRIREGTERRIGERRPSAPTAEAYEPEATETDAPCDCARDCTTTVSVHRSQPKSKKNQKKLKKGKK